MADIRNEGGDPSRCWPAGRRPSRTVSTARPGGSVSHIPNRFHGLEYLQAAVAAMERDPSASPYNSTLFGKDPTYVLRVSRRPP